MSTEAIIRLYESGDEEGITQLLDAVFNGWPDRDIGSSKVDFWKWKYLDNPIKKYAIVVAEFAGKIIGCSHSSYFFVNIGDKNLILSQGMDVAVDKDFRGMGLFNSLDDLKNSIHEKSGRHLNLAIHVNPILIERAKKLGRLEFPHEILDMLKVRDIKLHLENTSSSDSAKKELAYYLMRGYENFRNIFDRADIKCNDDFSVRDITHFDERFNEFWIRIKNHYNFLLERKSDYLNWKYCDPRPGKYCVRVAESDGQILGYSVLRINKLRAYHTGHIVDLLTLPTRYDVLYELIRDASTYFETNGINAVRYWVIKDTLAEKAARDQGFIDTRSGVPLAIFYLVNVGEEWGQFIHSASSKIHFQMGDTEWM